MVIRLTMFTVRIHMKLRPKTLCNQPYQDKKMPARCAHCERTCADFHTRMRSHKHTVVSAYKIHMGRTRASRTVCLPCATYSARIDTIGTFSLRVRVRFVRSRSHDLTARRAGNMRRTDCYLDRWNLIHCNKNKFMQSLSENNNESCIQCSLHFVINHSSKWIHFLMKKKLTQSICKWFYPPLHNVYCRNAPSHSICC